MRPHPRADFFVVGVAVTIFALIIFTTPDPPCSVADACDAEPVTSIAVSLVAAVAVMSFLHRWSAVAAAVACVVMWPIADRVDDVGMGWRVTLPLALLAVTVAVARLRFPPYSPSPDLVAFVASLDEDVRPALVPPAPPRAPARPVLGTLLLVAGLAGAGWTLWHQARVTAQEASASAVPAVVREHREDAVIGVDLVNGDSFYMEVLDAADYPVGSRVEVLIDDTRMRQLRTEPYDITILLLPTITAAGAGAALLTVVRQSVRGDNTDRS
ncbi:hypothetical protein AMIS_39520 [Actinoplanes missouriensis 431]|uniref:Uncharacterized protein n=1 Tax=Actinoplanes missouriensis (strain ATCC 14538 / DSM 43046 / CBS 188.64 / JCM 3121 / NBRC 102363 / NCIMB 12654 / NRRL B-3342 / UNCC 431) TaxID=512565 RepID=I0H835_ACTM4|nr:hypothetical protein [Actinoplanes missouriensis]BAL89172.1 hypothetical protein AMIS_39520 [Actinoplanes missouriensis 431]